MRELPNINERISYPNLRVVDADGSQLGVITREAALDVAKDRELDLVLVSEKADPPVCRIMDYGKYKFEQEKKAKEAKKKSHQTEVKEVKMRYKIDSHDYQVRIGQAVRFLKDGDKVVSDSWAIAAYLDHTYPDRPALMHGPQARAFAKFLNTWMDQIVGRPLVRSLYLDRLAYMLKCPVGELSVEDGKFLRAGKDTGQDYWSMKGEISLDRRVTGTAPTKSPSNAHSTISRARSGECRTRSSATPGSFASGHCSTFRSPRGTTPSR